jgi:hypothetical protein
MGQFYQKNFSDYTDFTAGKWSNYIILILAENFNVNLDDFFGVKPIMSSFLCY